jgi:hypothetical protein
MGYYGLQKLDETQKPDIERDHKYGWVRVNDTGEVLDVIDRTNPNAQWDWYELGGRWTGYFKLKEGAKGTQGEPGLMTDSAKDGYCDQLLMRYIDLGGMRQEAREKAKEKFDKVSLIIQEYGLPPKWEDVLKKYGEEHIQEARKEYHNSPSIKALDKAHLLPWQDDIYEVYCDFDEEKYLQQEVSHVLVPFAVVKESKWYEKGEMGWWGMSRGEKSPNEWNTEVSKLLDGLSPDTLLSLFDCHI